MGVGFVLLAGCAAFDISAGKGGKAWPPEFGSNKLVDFKKAGVASGFMIMTAGKDGAAEGVVGGNIDAAFVGEDARVHLPVSKAGAEREGNILVHGLECLQDKGVAGRSRRDALGESGVNEVDEKGRGEQGDPGVVVVPSGEKVRVAGEGIRAS